MTSQTFNLDLIPQGVPPIIHVSQYDKGQTWEIHLYENGIVFPVPANTSAAIQGTKPDSTGFQFPAVISVGDNVVTFTLEQQMTVFSGDIDCELVLVNGDDQVATINFILSVEPTTLDDDTVISETQLPLIEQAAELGAVINNYATQIHADAETASTAATAATSAATSASADATTATAAADDATASKTAAATSASNAATSETNAAASATAAASSASSAAQEATNAAASATAAASSASAAESAAQTAQAAMNGKLSTYADDSTQWDTTPTAGSTKPVTSGGIEAEFSNVKNDITAINNNIDDLESVEWTQFGTDYTFTPTAAGQAYINHSFGAVPQGAKRVAISQSQVGDIETFAELFKGHATCITEFSQTASLATWTSNNVVNVSYVRVSGTNAVTYKAFYK